MRPLLRISRSFDSLSDGQKRIGQYILRDSSALLLSNTSELANAVGVSEATVVRFARSLGYQGFPQLKQELQREMRGRLRAASRMQETFAEIGKEQNIVAKLIQRDIQLLQETLRAVSVTDFQRVVETIWKAKKVFIIGLNASLSLAHLLQFRLIRVKKDVRWLVFTGGSYLIEQLAFMEPEDVLIAIGFLSIPREIQIALQQAKKVGARVVGITDFSTSPIARAADVCLFAKQGLHTTVNSLTPAFSLINALAIALVWTKKGDSIKAMSGLDNLLEGYSL